jgi:hypothetical protein
MENMSEGKPSHTCREIIDGADLVFGVWANPKDPNGCDSIVIKGMHL